MRIFYALKTVKYSVNTCSLKMANVQKYFLVIFQILEKFKEKVKTKSPMKSIKLVRFFWKSSASFWK